MPGAPEAILKPPVPTFPASPTHPTSHLPRQPLPLHQVALIRKAGAQRWGGVTVRTPTLGPENPARPPGGGEPRPGQRRLLSH